MHIKDTDSPTAWIEKEKETRGVRILLCILSALLVWAWMVVPETGVPVIVVALATNALVWMAFIAGRSFPKH